MEEVYTAGEGDTREKLREQYREASMALNAARRGHRQAEAVLADLPKPKTKRERANLKRLEEEAAALDALIVEHSATVDRNEGERSILYRIAYLRGCIKAGWKLKHGAGKRQEISNGEMTIRIPDNYLPEWAMKRAEA